MNDTPYRIFINLRGGKRACVSPAVLRFRDKDAAEIVADRYRASFEKVHGAGTADYVVLPVDHLGYIVETA